jgi:TPR repeat protein
VAPPQVAARPTETTLPPDRPPASLPPAVIATLIRRGEAMRGTGDISAARLLFERAAEAGSAQAATEAGRLRDPAYLTRLGAIGVAPDPRLAADWYRRANALGDRDAAALLQRLEEAAR